MIPLDQGGGGTLFKKVDAKASHDNAATVQQDLFKREIHSRTDNRDANLQGPNRI
jgi:hypothetical protein